MAETRTIAELIEERFGLPTRAGAAMPAEGTVAQILSHRVQRRYKPDPIPDDVLEIVLASALSAPSKSDLQQVAIVLVRDLRGSLGPSHRQPPRRRASPAPARPDKGLYVSYAPAATMKSCA